MQRNILITNDKNSIGYKNRIGVIDKAIPKLYKKFSSQRYKKKVFNNYEEGFYSLRVNEINILLTSDLAFQHLEKENPWYSKFTTVEVIDEIDLSMRIHPNYKKYVPVFNLAITKMLKDGTIDKIFDKYK